MRRIPTWLKIALPIAVLLVAALVALVTTLMEEIPDHAQMPAIQARFADQIDLMKELSRTNPAASCATESSPEAVVQQVKAMQPWLGEVASSRERLADPAILFAGVLYYCGDSTGSFGVKSYEGPVPSDNRSGPIAWSPAADPLEWPAVSLWFAPGRRLVRYEDRLVPSGDVTYGIRLILDLNLLSR